MFGGKFCEWVRHVIIAVLLLEHADRRDEGLKDPTLLEINMLQHHDIPNYASFFSMHCMEVHMYIDPTFSPKRKSATPS